MKLIAARPPLWDEIEAAFGVSKHRGVVFAWGDRIFAPAGGPLSPEIMAHEAVHGERQLRPSQNGGDAVREADITGWWHRYIADVDFRLAEEIPAHQAEYRYLCQHPPPHVRPGFRNNPDGHLSHVARKLAAPLYGFGISINDAKRLILGT